MSKASDEQQKKDSWDADRTYGYRSYPYALPNGHSAPAGFDGFGVRGDLRVRRALLGADESFDGNTAQFMDWSMIDANEEAIDDFMFHQFIRSLNPANTEHFRAIRREERAKEAATRQAALDARVCPVCEDSMAGMRADAKTCRKESCRRTNQRRIARAGRALVVYEAPAQKHSRLRRLGSVVLPGRRMEGSMDKKAYAARYLANLRWTFRALRIAVIEVPFGFDPDQEPERAEAVQQARYDGLLMLASHEGLRRRPDPLHLQLVVGNYINRLHEAAESEPTRPSTKPGRISQGGKP